MRVEPGEEGMLRRMARAFPAGTMGGTRRADPIRERAQSTPTTIAQPGGGGGGGSVDAFLQASWSRNSLSANEFWSTTVIGGGWVWGQPVFRRRAVGTNNDRIRITEPGIYGVSIDLINWIGGTWGPNAHARLISWRESGAVGGATIAQSSPYPADLGSAGMTIHVVGPSANNNLFELAVGVHRDETSGTASVTGNLTIVRLAPYSASSALQNL